MEDAYLIKGGRPLTGKVKLSGAKNVALKVIIACLLFDQPVNFDNVPRINDIEELFHLIKDLGGQAEWVGKNQVAVDGRSINKNKISLLHGSKIRVSFMFFPILLRKFNHCYIPNPGGCRIGARPIDRIVSGMKQLGIAVEYNHQTGFYYAKINQQPVGSYRFPKSTHTGTELLILLALIGKEKIVLENCALEPEIDQLIAFLNQSGSKIQKDGSTIMIEPVEKLSQNKTFSIVADRNEAVTYASLAIASGGELTIDPIDSRVLKPFIEKVREIGGGVTELNRQRIKFFKTGELKSSTVETSPYPGFMTDWQPSWAILMTQAHGQSVIKERVFENRFSYVNELSKLGAKIEYLNISISNPKEYYFFNWDKNKNYRQAIKIFGPKKLHGGVLNIEDLRAGASLALAALIADGETVINNVSILERGYENFVDKIRDIGGNIKKI